MSNPWTGVDSRLRAAAEYASQVTGIRYVVSQGTRTQAEAIANDKKGTGVTNSLHIPDANGVGHAVDLKILNSSGQPVYPNAAFAAAMASYGQQNGFTVRWGNTPGFVHGKADPVHFDLGLSSRMTGVAYAGGPTPPGSIPNPPGSPRNLAYNRNAPMRGADVKQLQQQLTSAGFNPSGIDGVYGKNTAAAVKAFQTANGLSQDAVAGPRTMAALNNIDAPSLRQPTDQTGLPALPATGSLSPISYAMGGQATPGYMAGGPPDRNRFDTEAFAPAPGGVPSLTNLRMGSENFADPNGARGIETWADGAPDQPGAPAQPAYNPPTISPDPNSFGPNLAAAGYAASMGAPGGAPQPPQADQSPSALYQPFHTAFGLPLDSPGAFASAFGQRLSDAADAVGNTESNVIGGVGKWLTDGGPSRALDTVGNAESYALGRGWNWLTGGGDATAAPGGPPDTINPAVAAPNDFVGPNTSQSGLWGNYPASYGPGQQSYLDPRAAGQMAYSDTPPEYNPQAPGPMGVGGISPSGFFNHYGGFLDRPDGVGSTPAELANGSGIGSFLNQMLGITPANAMTLGGDRYNDTQNYYRGYNPNPNQRWFSDGLAGLPQVASAGPSFPVTNNPNDGRPALEQPAGTSMSDRFVASHPFNPASDPRAAFQGVDPWGATLLSGAIPPSANPGASPTFTSFSAPPVTQAAYPASGASYGNTGSWLEAPTVQPNYGNPSTGHVVGSSSQYDSGIQGAANAANLLPASSSIPTWDSGASFDPAPTNSAAIPLTPGGAGYTTGGGIPGSFDANVHAPNIVPQAKVAPLNNTFADFQQLLDSASGGAFTIPSLDAAPAGPTAASAASAASHPATFTGLGGGASYGVHPSMTAGSPSQTYTPNNWNSTIGAYWNAPDFTSGSGGSNNFYSYNPNTGQGQYYVMGNPNPFNYESGGGVAASQYW